MQKFATQMTPENRKTQHKFISKVQVSFVRVTDKHLNHVSYTTEDFVHYCKSTVDQLLETMIEVREKDYLTHFDYSAEISGYDILVQQKLWILRTSLLYQLLLIASKLFRNRDLFAEILKPYHRRFNDAVSGSLHLYKLGIFGSLTPTSDIDVGVQYMGNDINDGLAYIVSTVEDLFLLFTGMNSLRFDIEFYADMMTISNQHGEEVFYLDTKHFNAKHVKEMFPYVEASILRNYVFAMLPNQRTPQSVSKCLESFDFHTFFATVKQQLKDSDVDLTWIKRVVSLQSVSPKALHLVAEYMSVDYDTAREQYYLKVYNAEVEVSHIRSHYINNGYVLDVDPENIVSCMKFIAEALVFRAESYTCAPTVMHIVRVIQASNQQNKMTPSYPDCAIVTKANTTAFCNIGMYGYFMSILEQLGYIYRFYLTFCIENPRQDPEKCKKKLTKYMERVKNAVDIVTPMVKTARLEKDHSRKKGGKQKRRRRTFRVNKQTKT